SKGTTCRGMVLLEESAFLIRLTELYQKNRNPGTVYLQFKRYVGRLAATRKRKPQRQAEAAEGEEPRCLVRASSNKKHSKLSCVIEAKDILRFQLALGNILRSNMDGLKTREKTTDERKKEREQKLAAKAAKVKKDPADGKAAPVSAAAGSKKQGGKKKGR
ncbi:unnamed protein product, partial [Polarella glacialis]